MIINLFLLLFFSNSFFNPPFIDGDTGFYSPAASFHKSGIVHFSLLESYGIMKSKEQVNTSSSESHTQTNFNITYTPFSFVELGGGFNYYTVENENYFSGFMKPRIPFLTMEKTKISLAPVFIFIRNDKPQYGGNLNLEIIPFQNSNLPPFHSSNSFEIIKGTYGKKLIFSTMLSVESKRFQPFIEYYTELTELFEFSSSINSRFCSGIAYKLGIFGLKGGLEIATDEKAKQDFDYRFTGGVNLLWDTKKKPSVSVNILVTEAESGDTIEATVTLKGNNILKELKTEEGSCTFTGLASGLYTIEISSPEYKTIKAPLFIKEKSLNKNYKLKKIERR